MSKLFYTFTFLIIISVNTFADGLWNVTDFGSYGWTIQSHTIRTDEIIAGGGPPVGYFGFEYEFSGWDTWYVKIYKNNSLIFNGYANNPVQVSAIAGDTFRVEVKEDYCACLEGPFPEDTDYIKVKLVP